MLTLVRGLYPHNEHKPYRTELHNVSLCSVTSNFESISPLDDLAFDMYQDPEVAHIIRVLDQKKQEMVRQEKYEEAKNLKQAIADLQKVGQPPFTVCTAEWTSD